MSNAKRSAPLVVIETKGILVICKPLPGLPDDDGISILAEWLEKVEHPSEDAYR